jgi:alanyl-tRNA synthetase/misacylated tRNA(Ala) deacylase
MLEKVLGKQLKPPKTSDIEDGFAFNRYDKTGELTPEVVEKANTELRDHIDKGAEITTYPDKEKEGFRWWECLDYKIPCGGTHIANLNEVGELEIKLTSKKGKPTVNFKLL